MKLKGLILPGLILALILAGCAPRPAATTVPTHPAAQATEVPTTTPPMAVELDVSAAASLTAAFGEIGKVFEAAHPGVTVVFNFGGSQQLAQQIVQGAPADVFASANNAQMKVVIDGGEITSGSDQPFVKNRLVVIYPKDNPAGLTELKDLAKKGLKVVLAAKEVPVGGYALNFLDNATADPAFGASFKDEVLANVVSYEDNVKAVLAKVALGEADAGIVYTTDISGSDASKVGQLAIPDALNVIATYPIAPVKSSKNPELAQAFVDLVLSQAGQEILAKYNFVPIK